MTIDFFHGLISGFSEWILNWEKMNCNELINQFFLPYPTVIAAWQCCAVCDLFKSCMMAHCLSLAYWKSAG